MKLTLDPRKLESQRLRYRMLKQRVRVFGAVLIGFSLLAGLCLLLLMFTAVGREVPDRGAQIRAAASAMCVAGVIGWFLVSGAVGQIMDSLEGSEHLVDDPEPKRASEDRDELKS